ncbi:SDR family NAD(P)-dependent oxidoreductase, partial [Staphylococcus epidermidis]|uniref:SDR family NAD(P)-dependent oxidoreductase n=1 Tax=Staphylococcus epidermidis TaxID=1282 RepID=UPI0011A91CD3
DTNHFSPMIQTPTQHFRKIHILINNPLLPFKFHPNHQKSFKHLTSQHYQQQLNPTLKPPFNLTQTLIPQFIQQQTPSILTIPTNFYQNPLLPYHHYTTPNAPL